MTKEICKGITRYFIGDIDDPRLDEIQTSAYFRDFDECASWHKECLGMGFYEENTRVYTVKITLCED